jgi:hypothetical protein
MGKHNSGHCTQRNEHFKENQALRAGGDDNNANGDEGIEKAEDLPRDWGKNPTWVELRANLVFASKSRSNCQIQILLRDSVCHVADSKHNLRTKCRACLVRRAGPGPPWD